MLPLRRKKEKVDPKLREILRKVRKIHITTRKMVQDVFSGEYHSIFKGRGMDFAEVREYQPGDDIRTIDWNVTARMNHPYVKLYQEERELRVMVVVDMSGSVGFGTRGKLKREMIIEISALLIFSAINNNDLVGLLIFTDKIEKVILPKKGLSHGLRLIRDLLAFEPTGKKTNISGALEFLNSMLKRFSIVFMISDFLDGDFRKPLAIASKKHDFVPLVITDPAEHNLTPLGLVEIEDAETGELIIVDMGDNAVIKTFVDSSKKEEENLKKLFGSIGLEPLYISTEQDYVKALDFFFRKRARQFR